MLPYDPVPWLMAQEGLAAVRARRRLGLHQEGDAEAVQALGRAPRVEDHGAGAHRAGPRSTAGFVDAADGTADEGFFQ